MEEKKPQVFISYAFEDAVFADYLKLKLDDAGFDIWMDQENIKAGDEWRNEIDNAINKSDVLVIILSSDSCKSPYVTYEWAYALGRKKKLIPLLFKQPDKIHSRLSVFQHLNFIDHRKGPWDELFKQIRNSQASIVDDSKSSELLGNMTKEEFQGFFSGILALANVKAKHEGRNANTTDVSEAAVDLVATNLNMEQTTTTTKYILWVDDNPDNNIDERKVFTSVGFRCELAYSTNQALEKLSRKKYDAIISDMGRQEGPTEGYVLLDVIRKKDKMTPYFIYSLSNKTEDKAEAGKRGAQGYTNDPGELIENVIHHVINKNKQNF